MNETVEFSYWFSDGRGNDEKRVTFRKQNEEGLEVDTLCEAFVDFMVSSGFSEQSVYDYFSGGEEKAPW